MNKNSYDDTIKAELTYVIPVVITGIIAGVWLAGLML